MTTKTYFPSKEEFNKIAEKEGGSFKYFRPDTDKLAGALPKKWQQVYKLEKMLDIELSCWGKKKTEFQKKDLQVLVDTIAEESGKEKPLPENN